MTADAQTDPAAKGYQEESPLVFESVKHDQRFSHHPRKVYITDTKDIESRASSEDCRKLDKQHLLYVLWAASQAASQR